MAPQTSRQTNGVSPSTEQRTTNLVKWTTTLQYSHLPADVITRTKSFLLDTLACSIAGQDHPAVQSFLSFAKQMGPEDGKCEYFFDPEKRTSAAFAALVNGAACHVVELDDLNNAGMIHPVFRPSMIELSLGNRGVSCSHGSCTRRRLFGRGILGGLCSRIRSFEPSW